VLRFLEFFTVNIRNKNTRVAYARAAAAFLRWCEGQGIGELGRVQRVHVAAYIERLQGEWSAPTVKQHLACIRMLFDWLVTGQIMPWNPAHSVRGPRHSVSKGSTPVLFSEEGSKIGRGGDDSARAMTTDCLGWVQPAPGASFGRRARRSSCPDRRDISFRHRLATCGS
jgi:integrase/recombinase XerD